MRPELDETAAAPSASAIGLARTSPSSPLEQTATMPPQGAASASAGAGLAAGQQLGHFRVERQLGAGGMGEVYLATDLALDRPVAIKVLPDALARDAARRDRLIREARAQARVVHPNVGHIYFIGEERGLLFVAMEYVPGETLAQRAAAAPMALDDALAAVRGAALGLREAHRAGFLHRDVKPSNLMLDGHGVIKVLDFGLAAGGTSEGSPVDGPIAQTSLVGTPMYMAPEQARGAAIDVRADIYALGATLFHLVSGRPPFDARTADELKDLHASAPRPRIPAAREPRTAAALGDLCARMMAPAPADRFADYDELIAAIDTLATARTRPAGLWARCIASGLDGIVLGLGLLVLSVLLSLVAGDADRSFGSTPMFVGLALMQVLCVRRWGRTPGKALLDLEVVMAATGARPSWGAALRRAGALIGPPFAVALLTSAVRAADLDDTIPQILEGVVDVGMLGLLAYAAARSVGKRAPWDRVAGTLVRYRAAGAARR